MLHIDRNVTKWNLELNACFICQADGALTGAQFTPQSVQCTGRSRITCGARGSNGPRPGAGACPTWRPASPRCVSTHYSGRKNFPTIISTGSRIKYKKTKFLLMYKINIYYLLEITGQVQNSRYVYYENISAFHKIS